jgi:type II secretory ATPase GspE/PulE/Tfp pilus assembly ATPase PilB-like protein
VNNLPLLAGRFQGLADDLDLSSFEGFVRLAVRARATDIHLEPLPEHLRIRVRIEGSLQELAHIPHPPAKNRPHPMLVQIKARSELNLLSRVPEDGRCTVMVDGVPVNARIASMPQIYGEKIVIRLFDTGLIQDMGELGFLETNLHRVQKLIGRTTGMLLVAGPTGSGKTTTLYSILNRLNVPTANVVTIEDPVESYIPGINQIQVSEGGVQFETAIRSVLRLDPDILMIGEIRDRQTAETAFHAALTGHLVLSTVHAGDTTGVIMRLLDLGVPPQILAQATNGVIAQRLLPRLCPKCARADFHPPLEMVMTHESAGCPACRGGGIQGRCGIQEVLVMTDNLRSIIYGAFDSGDFRSVSLKEGMRSLKEDAVLKSVMGQVNYREALAVTDEPIERVRGYIRQALRSASEAETTPV